MKVKYAAKQIGRLSPAEYAEAVPALLIRISVITGWILPNGLAYTVLESEFRAFLSEQFPGLNVEEIAFAFRTYGGTVKEYGKNLNTVIVGEVLGKYIAARLDASNAEERIKSQTDDGFLQSRSNDFFRGLIQVAYSYFLAGHHIQSLNLHPHCYEILTLDGLIQPKFHLLRFKQYSGRLLYSDAVLVNYAKIKSVHQLFRLYKKSGFPKIYEYGKSKTDFEDKSL